MYYHIPSEYKIRRSKQVIFTKGQMDFLEGMEKWLDCTREQDRINLSVKERFSLLTGFPGTGKSTVVVELVKRLRANGLRVLLTTPTHFAKNVLIEFLDDEKIFVPVRTIYSLLGLKPEMNEMGDEIFIQDPREALDFSEYDFLIVDEVSMVNKTLWALLTTISTLPPCLCVGDPDQLRPVGSTSKSPIFTKVKNRFDLFEVVRYRGAIADYITAIRESDSYVSPVNYADGVDLVYCELDEWFARLKKAMDSQENCRALAYLNKNVDTLNNVVRQEKESVKRGTNAVLECLEDEFLAGDKLITKEPITRWNPVYKTEDIICHNGTYINVVHVEKQVYCDFHCYALSAWWTGTEQKITYEDGGERAVPIHEEMIWVLASSEKVLFAQKLQALKAEALSHPPKSSQRRYSFREYYQLKKAFTDVQHSYASTVHKAQGANLDIVFLYRDILLCHDPDTQKELNYVGCSRAKKQLVICK